MDRLRRRPFTIYCIHHSHIDIGYTHRQEQIEDFQRQFIGQALDLATSPAQADRAEHEKFRFLCEGFWAVEKFLGSASVRDRDRFARAVHDGLIELSAGYFHTTELLDAAHLRRLFEPALRYADSIGFELRYAASLDVNGFAWGYADAMADAGLKYFSTNINTHHGGRPFDRRNVPFYWRGPAGGRVLTWLGQAYFKGNFYGLVPLNDSRLSPAFPVGDLTLAEQTLLPALDGFLDEGYALDFLPLFASGVFTDNSPPTAAICEQIAVWNRVYGEACRIETGTMRGFFERLERHADGIPEFAGDWPDWWADGVACTPQETALARDAQRTLRQIERLDPDQRVVSAPERSAIHKQVLHYAEHTWGHSHTVPLPWSALSSRVLLRKGEYAVAADRLAMTAYDRVMKSLGEGDFVAHRPTAFRVVNPADVPRSALTALPLDVWEVSVIRNGVEVADASGRVLPHQVQPFARGNRLVVAVDLDAGQTLDLRVRPNPARAGWEPPVARRLHTDYFETADLRLEWRIGGGITALVDRATGTDLVEAGGYPMLAPVYQVFPSGGDATPQSLRRDAGIAKTPQPCEVSVGRLDRVEVLESGPVFTVLALYYAVRGASMYQVLLTLPAVGRWIEIEACVNKDNVWDAEGMYLAFPLSLDGGQWYLDRVGGPMRPGVDQLPRTCRDYYMVQEGALLKGSALSVAVNLIDTPLVHMGGLNLWTYTKAGDPGEATGPLMSWQTNNKWETNFKGYCGGFYGFRYALRWSDRETSVAQDIVGLHADAHPVIVLRTG
ncbi:MAG: hypothetical protein AAFX76_02445 [Planctomycetota bacterium]